MEDLFAEEGGQVSPAKSGEDTLAEASTAAGSEGQHSTAADPSSSDEATAVEAPVARMMEQASITWPDVPVALEERTPTRPPKNLYAWMSNTLYEKWTTYYRSFNPLNGAEAPGASGIAAGGVVPPAAGPRSSSLKVLPQKGTESLRFYWTTTRLGSFAYAFPRKSPKSTGRLVSLDLSDDAQLVEIREKSGGETNCEGLREHGYDLEKTVFMWRMTAEKHADHPKHFVPGYLEYFTCRDFNAVAKVFLHTPEMVEAARNDARFLVQELSGNPSPFARTGLG